MKTADKLQNIHDIDFETDAQVTFTIISITQRLNRKRTTRLSTSEIIPLSEIFDN
jgi:hypothetical protein